MIKKEAHPFNLSREEYLTLKKLNTPKRIQDFLNELDQNKEENGDTCMSPREVLKKRKAHCIEGALLAALALRLNGQPGLLVDLESNDKDFDHVITVFKKGKFWGAISKTNHAVLRYREPVYKSIRELVMSYFHEYFLNSNGQKTLRRYTNPIDIKIFDKEYWVTSEENVWLIPEHLANAKHIELLNKSQIANLRKADEVEIKAGKILEH